MATSFSDWEGTCLMHHGIKGQKWGVRRFQNPDGTLTPAGKKHEQKGFYKAVKREVKLARKADKVYSKGIVANVPYSDRQPSPRVNSRVLAGHKYGKKVAGHARELADLAKKWDVVGEKANDYENYVYNKYRDRTPPKNVLRKQARLYDADKAAMNAYTSKAKSATYDLIGKYGKKKLVVDRVFGIGLKKKAESIVQAALYDRAIDINRMERANEEMRKKSKGG